MNYSYTDIATLENCPECGANWVDKLIPEELWDRYSPPYFYSRVIGVELIDEDRINHWLCPDCNHKFPR